MLFYHRPELVKPDFYQTNSIGFDCVTVFFWKLRRRTSGCSWKQNRHYWADWKEKQRRLRSIPAHHTLLQNIENPSSVKDQERQVISLKQEQSFTVFFPLLIFILKLKNERKRHSLILFSLLFMSCSWSITISGVLYVLQHCVLGGDTAHSSSIQSKQYPFRFQKLQLVFLLSFENRSDTASPFGRSLALLTKDGKRATA